MSTRYSPSVQLGCRELSAEVHRDLGPVLGEQRRDVEPIVGPTGECVAASVLRAVVSRTVFQVRTVNQIGPPCADPLAMKRIRRWGVGGLGFGHQELGPSEKPRAETSPNPRPDRWFPSCGRRIPGRRIRARSSEAPAGRHQELGLATAVAIVVHEPVSCRRGSSNLHLRSRPPGRISWDSPSAQLTSAVPAEAPVPAPLVEQPMPALPPRQAAASRPVPSAQAHETPGDKRRHNHNDLVSIHRKLPFWIGIAVGVRLQKGGQASSGRTGPRLPVDWEKRSWSRACPKSSADAVSMARRHVYYRRLAVSGRRHSRALRQVGSAKQAAESAAVPWARPVLKQAMSKVTVGGVAGRA